MINRKYFYSAKRDYGDGSGSHSWRSGIISFRSFLPKPEKVKDDIVDYCESVMASPKGKPVQLIAFNRI